MLRRFYCWMEPSILFLLDAMSHDRVNHDPLTIMPAPHASPWQAIFYLT